MKTKRKMAKTVVHKKAKDVCEVNSIRDSLDSLNGLYQTFSDRAIQVEKNIKHMFLCFQEKVEKKIDRVIAINTERVPQQDLLASLRIQNERLGALEHQMNKFKAAIAGEEE